MPSNLSTLTLSCIGAGRLGRTLCRLFSNTVLYWPDLLIQAQHLHSWPQTLLVQVRDKAIYVELQPADIWLIATPDDSIQQASEALKNTGVLRESDTVLSLQRFFKCPGVGPQQLPYRLGTPYS